MLNLTSNILGSDGTALLCGALRDNTTLTALSLDRNVIRDEGARHLLPLINRNTTLRTLNLYFNALSPDFIHALGGAMNNNYSLTFITINHPKLPIYNETINAIFIRNNNRLKRLATLKDLLLTNLDTSLNDYVFEETSTEKRAIDEISESQPSSSQDGTSRKIQRIG
jgi:hypothetical protein